MMNPGIYEDITNAAYHSGEGESKSLLDLVRRSPVHYRARKIAANDNEQHTPTPAQMIGTAFHALLLEPHLFVKDYCLALRPQDVPGVIESKDELVALIAEANKGRLPKLPTSGSKDELVSRIRDAHSTPDGVTLNVPKQADGGFAPEDISNLKAAELKAIVESLNADRQGLLSDKGTMQELADTLRMEGKAVRLWSDVKAEWLQNNGQRIVLTQDQWDQLHRMRDAVMAHPAARALMEMEGGVAEHSVFWRDPATGLLCRCRPDWWIKPRGIIVDVKTTEDASEDAFARSVSNYRYHVQHPFYVDGINHMREQAKRADIAECKAFIFLAVEKSARVVDGVALGVAVYVLDAESAELGRIEYTQDLARIAECTSAGKWPGYGEKIQHLSLPQWKKARSAHLLNDAA